MHASFIDTTASFFELVQQNKKIHEKVNSTFGNSSVTLPTRIITRRKEVSEFLKTAFSISREIDKLNEFLKENRKEFLIAQRKRFSQSKNSTADKEREAIESEAKSILKGCSEKVDELDTRLEQLAKKGEHNPNILQHWKGVIRHLYLRLQSVSQFFADQKSIQLKQQTEEAKNGYLKLPPVKRNVYSDLVVKQKSSKSEKENTNSSNTSNNNINSPSIPTTPSTNASNAASPSIPPANASSSKSSQNTSPSTSNPTNTSSSITPEAPVIEYDYFIDENEKKLLEQENISLHNELETMIDQAKEVEKQVMEISELHTTFAMKVAQQSEDIEHTFQASVNSKSHIVNATNELQRATKRGVDFRLFVLLFFIILGFALLFLDYITP